MRCPKCGFTSYDHLETCKKCHKVLTDVAAAVNGTTYESVAPLFLKITREMEQVSVPDSVRKLDFEEIEDSEATNAPLRQGIDTEFVLDELAFDTDNSTGDRAQNEPQRELTVELDDFQDVSPRDEFTLDLEVKPEETEVAAMPPIDFGDLDISDLAPPAHQEAEIPPSVPSFLEEATELALSPKADAIKISSPKSTDRMAAAATASLEDLNFNGLDLESPAKIITGSAAGKRYLPSVKTGTALDKFDIDLGDLFPEKKQEKNN